MDDVTVSRLAGGALAFLGLIAGKMVEKRRRRRQAAADRRAKESTGD